MKLSNLFLVNVLVALIFGLAFLLIPGQTVALYGSDLGEGGQLIGRLFGAALLSFSVLTWFARTLKPSVARQAIVLCLFVGDAIAAVVSLWGQLAGVTNVLGWLTVAIYLFFAVAYGYFYFMVEERATGQGALS